MAKRIVLASLVVAACAFAFAQNRPAPGPDWPQWRGPDRTGISKETGLLKEWPEGGPTKLWTITGLGEGFSGISVKDGRIYTMGTSDGGEAVIALDYQTGKQLWATKTSPQVFNESRGNGPRCTPTTDDKFLYTEDCFGVVACLEAATGKIVWQISLEKDLGGKRPTWAFSESPLIVGKAVIVTPGGRKGAIAALDKKDGKLLWQSSGATQGVAYSSCILIDVKGKKQIVNTTGTGAPKNGTMIGVDAENGKLLWEFSTGVAQLSCCTPVYKDGIVVASSGYGAGTAAADISGGAAKELWHIDKQGSHHGGVILVGDHLYANIDSLSCIELKTGKICWQERSVGKGSLVYADGMFYCFSENNKVALVQATPEGCTVKGRFQTPRSARASWAHPVVCGGRLFIRDQDTLSCYDVKAK